MITAGLAEATSFVKEAELTPGDLAEVLLGGSLAMPYMAAKQAMLARGEYDPAQFRLALMVKDLNLAESAASGLLPVAKSVTRRFYAAMDCGLGNHDVMAVARLYQEDLA